KEEAERLKRKGFNLEQDHVKKQKTSEESPEIEKPTQLPSSNTQEEQGLLREATAERISDDSEELARVLTSMDAATVLAGGIVVPTGSGSIPTAGPPAADISTGSEVAPTASLIVTSYSRRKGKEVMVESDTLKKQRLQEQIDAQVTRELEEQQEKEHMRMNEQIARDVKDFKGMKFEEIEAKFVAVWKYVKDFIPMGSKEEAERLKRKGFNLEQEHVKKQKTSEEAPKIEKSTEEIPKEKMKEMMQLVPVEDVYVQALQVKHPIIDWKVHTEGQRSYWKIISIRPATSEKEMELWVELKRLYEPDTEDQLWTQTQNFMHAPVEWKLYDLCGLHQVTAKDKDIFMLVEKDYPLRKGLAIGMISYNLQVETYSRMANELVLKIYKIAKPTDSILSKHAVKFVKAVDRPAERPTTNKAETVKKPTVKYAEMKKVQRETSGSQNGAPMRPPHMPADHRPHGAPMRPPNRPVGHRPHGPPMRPMRSNMNGARPNRTSFNKQAHSYSKRPFQETT
nr:hypothetical protein [Tanacetum cinerariifolium]